MGPIRSLYEEGGDFERAVAQDTSGGAPIILRPVQLSDCGELCKITSWINRAHFSFGSIVKDSCLVSLFLHSYPS